MPDRDQRQPHPPVVGVQREQQVHRPRADRQQAQRQRAGEARDGQQRDADRPGEPLGALGRLQARQVGKQRGLHRLEQLQRRPGDQEGAEHDAGRPAGRHQQHRGVEQRLLGELDRRHRRGEVRALARAAALAERLAARVARQRPGHDEQRRERRRDDPERDEGLARRDPDGGRQREAEPRERLEQHEPAVEPEPLVAGEVAAGEVRDRVGEGRASAAPRTARRRRRAGR